MVTQGNMTIRPWSTRPNPEPELLIDGSINFLTSERDRCFNGMKLIGIDYTHIDDWELASGNEIKRAESDAVQNEQWTYTCEMIDPRSGQKTKCFIVYCSWAETVDQMRAEFKRRKDAAEKAKVKA